MKICLVALLLCFSVLYYNREGACQSAPPAKAPSSAITGTTSLSDIHVTLQTERGDIDLVLFPSKAPVTVANFLNLAKRGFYNGLDFHRVIPGFMAQGGDPQGTGDGDAGYAFEDEIVPTLVFSQPGLLAMANAGPRTNGSQFFITHAPTPWLNGRHTIFGKVTKGQEIVLTLQKGDKIRGIIIRDSTAPLFMVESGRLAEWNSILNKKFPVASSQSPSASPPGAAASPSPVVPQ